MTSNRLTAFWASWRATFKGAGVKTRGDTQKRKVVLPSLLVKDANVYAFPPRLHPLEKRVKPVPEATPTPISLWPGLLGARAALKGH